MSKATGYDLVRPCEDCPFRSDVTPYLRRDRAEEIADNLRSGSEFYCHKTTHLDDQEDDGYYVRRGGEQMCAGALISMENDEAPNQMMRIAERLRLYDHTKLDMDAPVWGGLEDFELAFED